MSTVSQADAEALNDPERWKSLSSDEQQRILHTGLENEFGDHTGAINTTADQSPAWDETPTSTKRDTLAAIEGALDETWMAHAFEGVDEKKTIPVELSSLTDAQQKELREKIELMVEVESMDVDSVDEAMDKYGEEAAALLDQLDDLDEWLPGFLASVSAESDFNERWWSETDFPGGFKLEVFYIIAERYSDEMRQIQSFREE